MVFYRKAKYLITGASNYLNRMLFSKRFNIRYTAIKETVISSGQLKSHNIWVIMGFWGFRGLGYWMMWDVGCRMLPA